MNYLAFTIGLLLGTCLGLILAFFLGGAHRGPEVCSWGPDCPVCGKNEEVTL